MEESLKRETYERPESELVYFKMEQTVLTGSGHGNPWGDNPED